MSAGPQITAFFHEPTNTVSYLVADPCDRGRRGHRPGARLRSRQRRGRYRFGRTHLLAEAAEQGLDIRWVLETHAHADHLSAASVIKARSGAEIAIGNGISEVRRAFAAAFGDFGESAFDRLLGRRGSTAARRVGNRGDGDPGSYAGLRHLPDRRRGIRRRYYVHARLWHRADRFPGRRCAPAVSLDAAHPCPSARDAPVHVPRLQGARTRLYSRGRPRSASRSTATSTSAAACPRMTMWRCAKRATRPCRCPNCSIRRSR